MTVYAVLAHGDPTTYNFTAHALAPHRIIVHIDASSDTAGYVHADHITYLRDRIDVHWGGFSVVEATLCLYREALLQAAPSEHIVLLSGQCVPVQTVDQIERALTMSPWRQHCRAGLLLDGLERNQGRVRKHWSFDHFDARTTGISHAVNACARRGISLLHPRRHLHDFDGISIAAGSQWTALTAECIDALLAERELVERTRRLLQYSLAPDEIFFHTLVHSTVWGLETATPSPTGKGVRPTAAFANLHHIDRSLTQYLSAGELKNACAAGDLFARKVDLRSEPSIRKTLLNLVTDTCARRNESAQ